MKERHIQLLGICLAAAYFSLIIWLYANEPKTFSEAATKASVTAGTYEVDQAKFDEGLRAFRQETYVAARDSFIKADPEKRDAKTQFYMAYSYYRQGWGRLSSDDALFRQGLESVNQAAVLDENFKTDDADLKLKTPAELKNELEQGLVITAEDFNPLKVMRERK
jgi:major membrane immunogen (membrane-anchored lipoprotein)